MGKEANAEKGAWEGLAMRKLLWLTRRREPKKSHIAPYFSLVDNSNTNLALPLA